MRARGRWEASRPAPRGYLPTVSEREVNHDWADRVQRRMRAANLPTPTALAKASGVDQSVISRWINEGRTPTIEALRKVAGPLKTPVLELLVDAGHLTRDEVHPEAGAGEDEPDVLEAIRRDPKLLPEAREHLLNQYGLLRRIGAARDDDADVLHLPRVARKRPGPKRRT